MKVVTLYFEDETVNLAVFPPDTPIHLTSEDGATVVTGGKILTDAFRIATVVPAHTHQVTGNVNGVAESPA